MTIVVAGGTGLIGAPLVELLAAEGHEVRLLTRREMPEITGLPGKVLPSKWDGTAVPAGIVDGADAVVNLAGEPIAGGRWTAGRKQRIIGSRVAATRAIVQAIASAGEKPRVLVNGSAVGYYGNVPSGEVTEQSPRGAGFLAETVEQWEQEALRAQSSGVRVVTLRIGVVLAREGGILGRMQLPFKLFAGGPIGSGRQWVSWVHRKDVLRAILHCLERQELSGPVNITAPDARTMFEFCGTMGVVLHRPSWLAVPSFVIRLLFGEMSQVVLQGQRVAPRELTGSGFTFRYSRLLTALIDLLAD
jgi:uncharacterized protein (TIGR01777 family)